ncbi:aminodeoxychorismate synthase component I [Parasphingopyxis sp. CP4]|uniref:aminodeoxychorismate synthase component I n=1 Tax=Parasphingopyxis sp. CP4 TaxID=2724527 RepID=UPI0015A00FBA|nr:aminodeoxychorismate synthase component I [Parasphingopyxis sp. CP4]QLC22339.1 aminodeoxychorismate synthase component I [Parasphingopyxis sp. CP4]
MQLAIRVNAWHGAGVSELISTDAPFVLLDDARRDGADARLFTRPVETVEARSYDEIEPALERLESAQTSGLHAAGYLAYEAGLAIEDKLAPLRRGMPDAAPPLLWFGLFKGVERIAPDSVAERIPDPAGAWAGRPEPRITQSGYEKIFERAQRYIAAGDIYQTNLTFACDAKLVGSPMAVYAQLRSGSLAGYGGIVWTGAHWLLSLSPELFFSLADGEITARPMKGTAERHDDPAQDAAVRETLKSDPKQRAENLMIVDLLRNDLSREAAPGSVDVPSLFHVETYPTVHQMTSTVHAKLNPGRSAIDLVRAIYPCGSITGAPKIRAMEIISELEAGPRGAYTGSIGWIDPSGDAAFNVAIRTLVLENGASSATLGLGSGIVADSVAEDEWRECLAKGAFVTEGQPRFDLIETMRFDPVEGVAHLEQHLARMRASARALGFAFDRHAARNELQAATFRVKEASKVRMLASVQGRLAIEIRPIADPPKEPVPVAIAPRNAVAEDFRLNHKTTARTVYADACVGGETFETLLEDDEGFLTEGCFTNLFVERDGKLVTPPLSRGLLPGILRETLIAEGRAVEQDLTRADLAGGFLIGNAVRGLIRATLA